MRLIDKIERKLYRFAIPNLPLIIAICLSIGFVLGILANISGNLFGKINYYCQMIPYNIIYGHEYWRLITWIFVCPFATSGIWVIFTPIAIFFYYYIGVRLEAVWGKFMLNLYIFGTIILMDAGIVVAALLTKDYTVAPPLACSQYLTMSMYLGFAVVAPNLTIMLYFLIPVKIKYLALIDILILAYEYYKYPIMTFRAMLVFSILPFVILFFVNMNRKGYSVNQMIRKKSFNKQMGYNNKKLFNTRQIKSKRTDNVIRPDFGKFAGSGKRQPIHRCAICGRTEEDNPYLEFRYCSKCNGNYEYCSDHIYTHEHKQ